MGIFSRRKKHDQPAGSAGEEPSFRALNERETEFIAGQVAALGELSIDLRDPVAIGRAYDTVLADWTDIPEAERPNPTPSINLIGVALGEHLVEVSSVSWGIASDEFGVDLALLDEESGWMTFPISAVAKRWAENEEGSFIPALATWVRTELS